jgi:hypothetical protein
MSTLLEVPVHTMVAGLCATCEHAPRCTHPRASGIPILECDDVSPLLIAIAPVTGIEAARHPAPPPRNAAKGLCSTCERFRNCTYPKLDGGVWHCNEFE